MGDHALVGTKRADAANVSPAPIAVTLPAIRSLPDGSTVELRDDADFTVDFTDTLRRIELRRGEAHFRVVSIPNRPFGLKVERRGEREIVLRQ